MSLVHPLRAFPPKPHADSHEYGGDDLVTDLDRLLIRGTEVIDINRNLKNIASGDIAGDLNVGGTVKPASLTLGSYVLDTLDGDNKVPSATNADSATQASKLVASGYTLDTLVANNKVPDSDKLDGLHASSFTLEKVRSYGNTLDGAFKVLTNDGSTYIQFRDTAYSVDYGLDVRILTNPPAGKPIFRILSSGGAERLRVEHSGKLYTNNNFECTGNAVIGGDLQVKGNDIKDSGGNIVISFADTGIKTKPANFANTGYVDVAADAYWYPPRGVYNLVCAQRTYCDVQIYSVDAWRSDAYLGHLWSDGSNQRIFNDYTTTVRIYYQRLM